jgi:hypothetical protein
MLKTCERSPVEVVRYFGAVEAREFLERDLFGFPAMPWGNVLGPGLFIQAHCVWKVRVERDG